MVEKHSSFLIFITVVTVLAVAGMSFYHFAIKKDFYLFAKVSCDPEDENCFVSTCEEEVCEETSFYKVILRKASTAPFCNEGDCPELSCEDLPNSEACIVLTCDNQEEHKNLVEIEDSCSKQ